MRITHNSRQGCAPSRGAGARGRRGCSVDLTVAGGNRTEGWNKAATAHHYNRSTGYAPRRPPDHPHITSRSTSPHRRRRPAESIGVRNFDQSSLIYYTTFENIILSHPHTTTDGPGDSMAVTTHHITTHRPTRPTLGGPRQGLARITLPMALANPRKSPGEGGDPAFITHHTS